MLDKEKRLLDILRINTYKLQNMYLRDIITNLPNLRFLIENPTKCLNSLDEIAILVIDLRRTKNIKAVFGYRFLEKLYRTIANKLKTLEDIYCLVTLHGGRFIVTTSSEKAESVASDIWLKVLSKIY